MKSVPGDVVCSDTGPHNLDPHPQASSSLCGDLESSKHPHHPTPPRPAGIGPRKGTMWAAGEKFPKDGRDQACWRKGPELGDSGRMAEVEGTL